MSFYGGEVTSGPCNEEQKPLPSQSSLQVPSLSRTAPTRDAHRSTANSAPGERASAGASQGALAVPERLIVGASAEALLENIDLVLVAQLVAPRVGGT